MITEPITTNVPIVNKIPARHPVRGAFAACSSRNSYYDTKGHAISEFDAALAGFGLHLDCNDCMDLPYDFSWATLAVLNAYDMIVGYARLSWYRMESGRYEFTGYIT